jgi:hypothetical protein
MKYAVEMSSGATTYIPSFVRTGSGIQKIVGGRGGGGVVHIQIYRKQGDLISLLLFFQDKENGLKMNLKETECEGMDYIQLAQDRVHQLALVNRELHLQASYKAQTFLIIRNYC